MYDVIVIGAGIVGGSIFRELTKYNVKVLALDKEPDVAMGATKANSAIIHAGFDPTPGSVVSKYNVKGNLMYKPLCQELDVPYKQNGSLVVAFCHDDIKTLERLRDNGTKMGVRGLQILNKAETLAKEPNLNYSIVASLWAPSGAMICPFQYGIALFENAVSNGGELLLNKEVSAIEKTNNIFAVSTKDGSVYKSRYVVNAAGLYADKIHNMVARESFSISPRIGEYIMFDKTQGTLFKSTIFPCPSKMGKGVLVSPTVHGNLFVGPNAINIDDKEYKTTNFIGLDEIKKVVSLITDKIDYKESIKNFAGLRAIPSCDDFIIEENSVIKGFIDVAGIKSPGLTAAPAIALDVINILENAGLKLVPNKSFNPRRKSIAFFGLSDEEKNAIIVKNPLYGKIICQCENITEGEILEAIDRCFTSATVDGIKRRCRPGMGRCQGQFCGPLVQDIIDKNKKQCI